MLLANLGYIFFNIVGIFLSIFINATYYFNYYSDKYFENPPTNKSEYEFIVVGSGSSGSVVAGRLAEAGHKILLVEAGGPSHFLQEIPGMAASFLTSPYDWGYSRKPNDKFHTRPTPYPRGYSLGGSSMLNYMLYFRGNPEDFNEWEKLGNSGWGWKDVLPFFKKAERFAGPNSNVSYGTKGRLDVMPNTYIHKIVDVLAEAVKSLGFQVGDINDENFEGEGFWHTLPLSLRNGARRGTYRELIQFK